MVNNKKAGALLPTANDTRTVFNALQDANVTWAIYWDHEDVVGPLAWLSQDQLAGLEDHFFDMGQFLDDAANGNLPGYTFIEPRFLLDHNDQHPGSWFIPPIFADKVSNGEALMSQVYQAVRNSPQWNQTLLVITYDEHGGCYDHVQPPTNATPPNGPGQEGFDFTRFGVRVPMLVISPYTQVGQVFRPPAGQTFDHTSILKTVMELLIPSYNPDTDSLTPRDQAAPDLSPALQLPANPGGGLTNPRTDLPDIPDTSELAEATADPLALEVPLTDFQKSIVLAAMRRKMGDAGMLAAAPPPVETVGDALEYLRAL
jgi:phospholipase C